MRAAMAVEPGIQADNGVIYGIDQVIVPESIEKQLRTERTIKIRHPPSKLSP